MASPSPSDSRKCPDNAQPTRSPAFYWHTVIFKVEDTYFRVGRETLVNASHVFADMFLLPAGNIPQEEGATDDHPIELVGYEKRDFATFLRALYPSYEDVISGGFTFSEEEWISVLKLSTIWGIQKLRDQSIDMLSGITPVQKVILGRAHQVRKWLLDGIAECVRNRSKTIDGLLQLGLETAFKVLWIRDQCATLHGLSFNPKGLQFKLSLLKCADCMERYYTEGPAWSCGSCNRSIGVDDADAITLSHGQCEWMDGKEHIRIDPPNMQCTSCALPVLPSGRRVRCPRCNSKGELMEFILEGRADLATLVLEEFGDEIMDSTVELQPR